VISPVTPDEIRAGEESVEYLIAFRESGHDDFLREQGFVLQDRFDAEDKYPADLWRRASESTSGG